MSLIPTEGFSDVGKMAVAIFSVGRRVGRLAGVVLEALLHPTPARHAIDATAAAHWCFFGRTTRLVVLARHANPMVIRTVVPSSRYW
jgi:hypothetical protein